MFAVLKILEITLEIDVGKVILLASNDETPCAKTAD
jgi:hypothetical protein